MKTIILAVIFSSTITAPLLAYDTNVLSNEESRVSYAIGLSLGENWNRGGIDVNDDLLLRGLKDGQSGATPLMTKQELTQTLMQFRQELIAKAEKQRQAIAETNEEAGEAFLAKNKKQKGVITLPDGLQYKVITEGTGPSPTTHDMVKVNYVGKLIDGTKFDSSDNAQMSVGGVIRGWSEALTHMKVGSEWQLFIPSNLAYGSQGRPPQIGPNSVLIFTVKLLSIVHPQSKVTQPITSDIVEVPSAAEMKKGAKVKILKPDEVQKAQQPAQPAK